MVRAPSVRLFAGERPTHIRLKGQARAQHAQQIRICGRDGQVASILREVPICGEQADRVGALACPPDGTGLTPRTARTDTEGLRAQSTANGCLTAPNTPGDFLRSESLVYVQAREFFRVYRMPYQDAGGPLSTLIDV